MDLSIYIELNKPKNKVSKKALKEHNKALYVAWYNIYVHQPSIVLNQAKEILNK